VPAATGRRFDSICCSLEAERMEDFCLIAGVEESCSSFWEESEKWKETCSSWTSLWIFLWTSYIQYGGTCTGINSFD
jgi:hypothetical protein